MNPSQLLTQSACVLALASTLLAGCSSPVAPVAVAAGPSSPFKSIQDLAVDSQDRIFVAEVEPGARPDAQARIYLLAADGSATPFAGGGEVNDEIPESGSLDEANLVGMRGITIRDDVLYLTGLNCLRKIDLKQAELSIQTHWGTCMSAQQFQLVSAEGSGQPKPVIFNHHLTIGSDQTIYADYADGEKRLFKLGSDKTEPEQLSYAYDLLGMAVNSKGELLMSHPWPETGGPGYIEKRAPEGRPLRIHPGAGQLLTDSRDQIYILDGKNLVRYATTGHRKVIGELNHDGLTAGSVRLALNPAETTLYVTAGTAIYRFPLPKD